MPGRSASTFAVSAPVMSTANSESRSPTRSHAGLYSDGRSSSTRASTAALADVCEANVIGSSPRERLSGSLVAGRLVSPATTPASFTASHVPPASSSRPPTMRGLASRKTAIGVAGRSNSSSRLAPTTNGKSRCVCVSTISRHMATCSSAEVPGQLTGNSRSLLLREFAGDGDLRGYVSQLHIAALRSRSQHVERGVVGDLQGGHEDALGLADHIAGLEGFLELLGDVVRRPVPLGVEARHARLLGEQKSGLLVGVRERTGVLGIEVERADRLVFDCHRK